MQITCFIFMGSSIIYYKGTMKVESSMAIKRIARVILIIIGSLLIVDALTFTGFTVMYSNNNSANNAIPVQLCFGYLFIACQVVLFLLFYRLTSISLK